MRRESRKRLLLLGKLGSITGDKNTIDSSALCCFYHVAVFDMPSQLEVQFQRFPVIKPYRWCAIISDPLYCGETPGMNMSIAARCGEGDALSYSKVALFLAVYRTLRCLLFEECGIVGGLVAIAGRNGKSVGTAIDGENCGCAIVGDSMLRGPANFIVDLITRCVVGSETRIGTERLYATSRPCCRNSSRMSWVNSRRSPASGATTTARSSWAVYARATAAMRCSAFAYSWTRPCSCNFAVPVAGSFARNAATACWTSVVELDGRKSTAAVFEISVVSRWPRVSALLVYTRASSEAREIAT